MKLAIGSDHAGLELKQELLKAIVQTPSKAAGTSGEFRKFETPRIRISKAEGERWKTQLG